MRLPHVDYSQSNQVLYDLMGNVVARLNANCNPEAAKLFCAAINGYAAALDALKLAEPVCEDACFDAKEVCDRDGTTPENLSALNGAEAALSAVRRARTLLEG